MSGSTFASAKKPAIAAATHPSVQRKEAPGAHAIAGVPPIVQDALQSSGQPLDTATRAYMEPRFGMDFSQVRVHTDAKAAESARAVDAQAYTVGRDVVFSEGHYTPHLRQGSKLLAHELAHVIQQERGGASTPPLRGGVLEQDADATASALATGDGTIHVREASAPGLARQPQFGSLGPNLNEQPRSLREGLHAENLSPADLEHEIKLILKWLKDNPSHTFESNRLRSELEQLQLEEWRRQEKREKRRKDEERMQGEVGDLETVNVDDPRLSPRYIDNIFEGVRYNYRGPITFYWIENGRESKITISPDDIVQDKTLSLDEIMDVHANKLLADEKVKEWWLATKFRSAFYSFYRTSNGIIMPTQFSKESTPKFYAMWPSVRQGIIARRQEIVEAVVPLANAINPIPGTKVDAHGLTLSSDPLDYLAFLHLRKIKIKKQATIRFGLGSGNVITRRLRTIGIEYHVTGLANSFEAITGISVYVLRDAEGTVLYVGEGIVFGEGSRLRSHVGDIKNTQKVYWGPEVSHLEVHATNLPGKNQSLALEEELIQQLNPVHNEVRKPYEEMHFGEPRSKDLPDAQPVLHFDVSFGQSESTD